MRFVSEYRDPGAARRCAERIAAAVTRPWTLMEVCGGQTHSILRHGVDAMLPAEVDLLHGPGCPVCVTAEETVDAAIALARTPGVTLCSFGDMLRVPGSGEDLIAAKADGADVRMVYAPLDALDLARRRPERTVVFFAVGFETTAPATALAVYRAAREQIDNFAVLVAHVRVPPALEALLAAEDRVLDGFLAAGHVCTVMGCEEYEPIAAAHRVPIVVTGFEPLDLLQGILLAVRQLEAGRAEVENQYARCVRREGNREARALLAEVFRPVTRPWRGMGAIPGGGLALAPAYAAFDAERRFALAPQMPRPERGGPCISGAILRGARRPRDCPAFGQACTPEHPLGATMVSTEGACQAYYRYRRTGRAASRA